ncbi:hypothetical protein Dimus_037608, partial [Dionaea muscipula]
LYEAITMFLLRLLRYGRRIPKEDPDELFPSQESVEIWNRKRLRTPRYDDVRAITATPLLGWAILLGLCGLKGYLWSGARAFENGRGSSARNRPSSYDLCPGPRRSGRSDYSRFYPAVNSSLHYLCTSPARRSTTYSI